MSNIPNFAEIFKNDDDQEQDDRTPAEKLYARAIYPYPLATGGAQLLRGRSRACCFWVSVRVPDGTAYIVDSTQILQGGGSWTHNPAQDAIPENALLVVINPRYEDQIRKAMATWDVMPGPSWVAARIIDSECKKDPTLAGRINWKVRS